MRIAITGVLVTALLLNACHRRPDVGPVVVSVIGVSPLPADANRPARSEPDRVLAGAVAQGLVRFDASGQIEPGLAERWIVIDEGRTYIFRLRRARWSDGRAVTAREIVALLKRRIAAASRNPLLPYLSAVDTIVEMTPDVIEVRLSRSRPDLLALFAQPEFAVSGMRRAGGTGPFHIVAKSGRAFLLRPVPDADRASDERGAPTPEDNVRLIGEPASRAIVRFVAKRSDLVSGGTVTDWPLTRRAAIAPNDVRRDPAAGLFGLAVVDRSGFLGDAANRAAIAGAVDRAALTAAVAENWASTEEILPEQLDSAAPPALPVWLSLSGVDRRATARNAVDAWKKRRPGDVVLRLALPSGPGGTLLWGRLAADLLAIGVTPIRVGPRDPADLRLIDAVAPYDSARWYLATACIACGTAAAQTIEAARVAPTLGERAAAIAAADAALAEDGGYIPLARPFRWSLVAPRLRAWRPNARAWHPLNHLRADPK